MKYLVPALALFSMVGCMTIQAQTSMAELADARYSGIYDQAIQLSQGSYEGDPLVEGGASRPTVGLVPDFLLTGDLNDDDADEAVVQLWENSGGSGTNNYVAVMGRDESGVVNLATLWLGNRVQLRHGRIVEGVLEADVLQHGENDAMCCPTQLATRSWVLDGSQLIEQPAVITGSLQETEPADG